MVISRDPVYLRTGIIDRGQVGKPEMSGALRLALAKVEGQSRRAGGGTPAVGRPAPSVHTVRGISVVMSAIGLFATIAWSILLAWLAA